MALLLNTATAQAQFSPPQTTPVNQDAALKALKPPPGVRVAMIEFYDLECPMCRVVNPTLIAAANQYKISWIRHDFLIPSHIWSRQAAINARFFDATQGQKVGNDYRDYIFVNQQAIETLPELNACTQKFADAHVVKVKFPIVPMGKFADEVDADVALGKRIGILHTPTVFIVASGGHAPQYTEVVDPQHHLDETIDQILRETPPAAKPTAKKAKKH